MWYRIRVCFFRCGGQLAFVNNSIGPRAAQVVPHVHFHIIPRKESLVKVENRSWTMFGRGGRGDLDDEEGAQIAEKIRAELRSEIERAMTVKSSI
jgi:diadenosine tetraphosphate (Ap4A) HIT family hydrolase